MTSYTEMSGAEQAKYAAHIRDFPLESIRDDAHLAQATAKIDRLLDQPHLSPGDEVYLDALSDLTALYEAEHVILPDVSGVEVLRHLMEEHDLRQKDLVPIFGSKSTVSEVLGGKRPLALAHIAQLSAHFGFPADIFITPAAQRLSEAERQKRQAVRSRVLLNEMEQEHGPVPEEIQAEVNALDWPK
jgi:HTH-type transcriptional regulator / antitoxin HigA